MQINDKQYQNGYTMGTVMFGRCGLPEIKWVQECMSLHVGEQCCDADGEIAIWQVHDNGKREDGIILHPQLDISDARRLAGILMSWADYYEAENEKEEAERHGIGSNVFLSDYPDAVTIKNYGYIGGIKCYQVQFADGTKDVVKESDVVADGKEDE